MTGAAAGGRTRAPLPAADRAAARAPAAAWARARRRLPAAVAAVAPGALARTEQEIEPRLARFDGGRAGRPWRRFVRGSGSTCGAARRARQVRLLSRCRATAALPPPREPPCPRLARNARAQALDGGGRHLHGRLDGARRQPPPARRFDGSRNGRAGDRLGRQALDRHRPAGPHRPGGLERRLGAYRRGATRASSATTADRPTSRRPPTSANVPARINVGAEA